MDVTSQFAGLHSEIGVLVGSSYLKGAFEGTARGLAEWTITGAHIAEQILGVERATVSGMLATRVALGVSDDLGTGDLA